VFGGENGRVGDPVDGLINLLKKHMGDAAPRKNQVQPFAEGLDAEDIDMVRQKVNNVLSGHSTTRTNPWQMVQRELANKREAKRFS
jgi:hypothetical protein